MFLSKNTWKFLQTIYLKKQFKKPIYLKFTYDSKTQIPYSFLHFQEWSTHNGKIVKTIKKNKKFLGLPYRILNKK